MARRTAATKADAATRTGTAGNVGRTIGGSHASIDRGGRPEASVSRTRPDRGGADRVIASHGEGRTSPTVERSGRIHTSSTPRHGIEQREFGRQATERTSHSPSAQGGAPSAPAGVNRGVTVPKALNRGGGESVSAPKAQNWNGVMGGQGSVGSAFSRGGAVGAGVGRRGGWSGGGGGAYSRGGTGGLVGGGTRGGSFHGGR